MAVEGSLHDLAKEIFPKYPLSQFHQLEEKQMFFVFSFAQLAISLLSTSFLIPQSWKTTSARKTSIVVFDLKAAL